MSSLVSLTQLARVVFQLKVSCGAKRVTAAAYGSLRQDVANYRAADFDTTILFQSVYWKVPKAGRLRMASVKVDSGADCSR